MKKYIYIIILLSSGLFFSCNDDIDGKLDGIEDVERPKEVGHYEHTIVEADFSEIVKALRAEGTDESKALADKLNKEKQFSEELNPVTLIPYFLPTFLKSPDVGASVDVTYTYNEGRTTKLTTMSEGAYVLTSADYAKAWKNPSVDAYTPAQSPAANLPDVLKEQLTGKTEGTYANVNYFYSTEEPYVADVRGEDYILEDFENNPSGAGTNVKVDLAGWINTDLTGVFFWQNREYSKNKYAQVTAFRSGTLNDIWLISPEIDLKDAKNPRFAFDISVGNYNKTCLKVFVSDNFDGNKANILSATWTDITSSFPLPTPASGYSTWATAGSHSLSTYKGKKVHVAFRYEGDDAATDADKKKTTTYQIDNVTIHENIPGIAVKEKSLVYDLYVLKADVWSKVTDANTLVLQPSDFKKMGVNYLSVANAPEYLNNYLKLEYPFATVGSTKTIVYRTSTDGTKCYADEFTLVNNNGVTAWTTNSFIETKTDQFIFGASRKWVFDPTFVVEFAKPDYQVIVEYVKVNQAIDNPNLIDRDNTELFYGFSSYYGNVNYRDIGYRAKDVTFAALGDDTKAKRDLMNRRTEEAFEIYLAAQYPDATAITNGVEQFAELTVVIYRDPAIVAPENIKWTYKYQCVGSKEWKFIERKSETGITEKAGEY